MLKVIAIKVRVADHRRRGIRWSNAMTRVLPPRGSGLVGAGRVGLRYLRRNNEGVLRQQIVNGIGPSFVTTSEGGVITIDLC